MRLFIQIENGQPIQHPIMEKNLLQAFPGTDIENLPERFANFVRVPQPILPPYYIFDPSNSIYEWHNGYVKDVWSFRPMTEKEIEDNYDLLPLGVTRV